MSFTELVRELAAGAAEDRRKAIEGGIETLRNEVKGKEARFYIGATLNFGHQATSMRVLQFMTARLQPKTILVRYRVGSSELPTRAMLARIIPKFDANKPVQSFEIGSSVVTFEPWSETPPSEEAPFGATGGTADGDKTNYAAKLNVRWFLRLQPYRWPAPNDLQQREGPAIALAADDAFGSSFQYRAFHVPKPQMSGEEWALFEKKGTPEEQESVKVARMLLEQWTKTMHLGVAYSVQHRNLTGVPGEWILCAYGGGIAAAQTAYKGPAAVAVLSVLQAKELRRLLNAELTQEEKENQLLLKIAQGDLDFLRSAEPGKERWLTYATVDLAEEAVEDLTDLLEEAVGRQQWLRAAEVPARTKVFENPKAGELLQELATLSGDELLFVIVARPDAVLPAPVFNLFFGSTSLPAVFEGLPAASLALSVGNPYLQMLHRNWPGTPVLYPSETLHPSAYTNVAGIAQTAANVLTTAIRTSNGSSHGGHFGAEMQKLRSFIENAYVHTTSPLRAYFDAIRDFYSLDVNDKLALGVGFTGAVMSSTTASLTPCVPAAPPPLTTRETRADV